MESNKKKWTILIALLLLITIAAVSVTIWALFFREPETILPPNHTPIDGDSDEKMDVEEGGGAVSLTYSNKVTIDLSNEKATLMFANPGKSVQDMVVQVIVQDTVLVQSGRLTPGNQVTTLDLLDGAAKKLSPGIYEGKFLISYYDPDTGEMAVVNTEIPITITVQE